jgi:transposase
MSAYQMPVGEQVVKLKEWMMILELHRQGLSVSAIAERTGHDRKTVRKYIREGLATPKYKPRHPRPTVVEPYEAYLRERVTAWPELSGERLLREIRGQGYVGGRTAVNDFLRTVRPPPAPIFEVRFETPPGEQAQVDFAEFKVCIWTPPLLQTIRFLALGTTAHVYPVSDYCTCHRARP